MRVLNENELAFVNGGDGFTSGQTNCASLESDKAAILYDNNMSGDEKAAKMAQITQRAAGCANHGQLPGYTVTPVYGTIGLVTGNGVQVTDPNGNYLRFVSDSSGNKAFIIGGSISF